MRVAVQVAGYGEAGQLWDQIAEGNEVPRTWPESGAGGGGGGELMRPSSSTASRPSTRWTLRISHLPYMSFFGPDSLSRRITQKRTTRPFTFALKNLHCFTNTTRKANGNEAVANSGNG